MLEKVSFQTLYPAVCVVAQNSMKKKNVGFINQTRETRKFVFEGGVRRSERNTLYLHEWHTYEEAARGRWREEAVPSECLHKGELTSPLKEEKERASDGSVRRAEKLFASEEIFSHI